MSRDPDPTAGVRDRRAAERRAFPAHAVDLLGVRRGEVLPVALMTAYGFLALTSYYVLKPVRNSVFLDRVGADTLPVVYILVALVVTGAAMIYSRFVDRWSPERLIQGTFVFLAAGLLAFRGLLTLDSVMISGAFFIWGKLYPLFLVSQFWLTGNLVFTQAQARRLFNIVGLGLIVGGIAGGGFAGFTVTALGTENLVVAAIFPLLGCSFLVHILMSRHLSAPDEGPSGRTGRLVERVPKGAIRLLRESGHLRNIAALLLVTILVSTIVDWQFNRAIELFVLGEDAKTAFFGRFFATVNIASVLFQLVLTGLVLRRFGVGVAVFVLPLAIALGTSLLFVLPVLLGAALLKGLEGTVRYSLDQSSREYLFLPIPYEEKARAKPLIDLAVYRGGTGVGGLLLLVLVNVLGLTVRQMAFVAGALLLVWGYLAVRARLSFRSSVRALIGARDIDIGELVTSRSEDGTTRLAGELVKGGVEESGFTGLPLVDRIPPVEPMEAGDRRETDLLQLARESPDPEVRRAAEKLLEVTDGPGDSREVVRLLAHDSQSNDAALVIRRADGAVNAGMAPFIADTALPALARVRLPPLLYDNATRETVLGVIEVMPGLPSALRYRCLKLLDRLSRNREELLEDIDVSALIDLELEEAYRWTVRKAKAGEARGLLARTLDERRWQSLERLFRALGLNYGVRNLYAAYRGIRGGAREYGLELLEITVGHGTYRTLAPLVRDGPVDEDELRTLRDRVGAEPHSRTGENAGSDRESEDPMMAVLVDREAGRLPQLDTVGALVEHLQLRAFTSDHLPSISDPRGIVDDIERAERLSETDLFGGLTSEDLLVLGALSEPRSIRTGETVIGRGEVPRAIYVLLEGRIETRRGEEVLTSIDEGETIGQLGLLDGRPVTYDAVAARDSVLLVIAHEDVLDLMEHRFSVVQALLRYLGTVVRSDRPDMFGDGESD